MTVTAFVGQCTGGLALLAYIVEIMNSRAPKTENTGNNLSTSYKYSIVIGIIILSARVLTSSTLHFLGVKKTAVFGVCLQCIGYAMMAYASLTYQTTWNLFYLNMVGIYLTSFAYFWGICFIPSDILGHVFSADTKAYAGIPITLTNVSMAIITELHPYLYLYLGGYLYFAYILTSIIFGIFVLCFVPETYGKTPEECVSKS